MMYKRVICMALIILMICPSLGELASIEDNSLEKIEENYKEFIVHNSLELNDLVANQEEDMIIFMAEDFVTDLDDTILINKTSNFDLIIDGNDKTLFSKKRLYASIEIRGLVGDITIRNLNLNGNNLERTSGIEIFDTDGQVYLKNMNIENHNRGLTIYRTHVRLDNIGFRDNLGRYSGGAIGILGDYNSSNIEIYNSSFIGNNLNHGMTSRGGGAISCRFFAGKLTIKNSLFEGNIANSRSQNFGVGGGGGAIFLNDFMGELDIDSSYFKDNSTNIEDLGRISSYDGGAILIYGIKKNNKINISNSTFENNTAKDGGGAIMLEAVNIDESIDKINFVNNSFYNNKAHGLGEGPAIGGGIQIYTNLSIWNNNIVTTNLKNNTFYKNSVGIEGNTRGVSAGALGLRQGSFGGLRNLIKLDNNIFMGNIIIKEDGSLVNESDGDLYKFRNVNVISTKIDEDIAERNLGIDNGLDIEKIITLEDGSKIKLSYDEEDVFGKYEVALVDNHGSISAGADASRKIIPTLPIKPQLLDLSKEITADNISTEELSGLDQRAYPKYRDMGSIEMSYVNYDANKIDGEEQSFSLEELKTYDGSKYYESNRPKLYFDIGFISDKKIIKDGMDLGLGDNFIGWSRDPEATKADNSYAIGEEVELVGENLKLYAVYKLEDKYSLLYDGNGNTGGQAPLDENSPYKKGDEALVLGRGTLEKEGFKFRAWNTEKDGTGKTYSEGNKIKISEDTRLYANWEVEKTEEKPVDPGKPIKPLPPKPPQEIKGKLNKKEHFAYIEGYPDGEAKPEREVRREEAVAIIFRILDRDYRDSIRNNTNPFKDVSNDRWSAKHIGSLSNAGIVRGYSDGTFRPDARMSRGELVTLVAKLLDRKEESNKTIGFNDVKGHWAEDDILYTSELGLINGYLDGSFKPDNFITRAEFVKIINKLLERGTSEENMLEGRKVFNDLNKNKWYYNDMEEALNSHDFKFENDLEIWTKLREFNVEY